MTKMDWNRVRSENLARRAEVSNEPEPRKATPIFGHYAQTKYGHCPECKAVKWWDNGPAKASGRYKPSAPDAVCACCGYKAWPKNKTQDAGSISNR